MKILAFLCGIDYRLYFAKWMLRLGRFHDHTTPGVWLALLTGGVGMVMFTCMGTLGNAQIPTFKNCTWAGVKGAFVCTAVLYLIWEICQGLKALYQWAGRYTRGY